LFPAQNIKQEYWSFYWKR